jgi:two-component system response regulator HydG
MQQILVIDDDRDMRYLLARFLKKNDFDVWEAENGKAALAILETRQPNLILCDFKLGDMNGNDLLKDVKERFPGIPTIIITGYADIRVAIAAMKLGAYDYVIKPLIPDELLITIHKALAGKRPAIEVHTAPKVKKGASPVSLYIFGDSLVFRNLIEQINRVAPTNYSVIIYGETGSGKEAVAQEIHKRSDRNMKPFVAIDCGALSKELAGSELFGHEKGAFTGAILQKTGSFEIADGGTIFLDEIANLPYDVQVSLLRVISERKIRRVGGSKDIALDVRIIVASNQLLWDQTRQSNVRFREDLFHRFNEFAITIPPLRERKEDIMVFAEHFLAQSNAELKKSIQGFSREVSDIFKEYAWYGNLREMKNVVKRAALLTDTEHVEARSLPFEIVHFPKLLTHMELAVPDTTIPIAIGTIGTDSPTHVLPKSANLSDTMKGASIDAEYGLILKVLKEVNFNKTKAAKLLNIDRKTLYNKLDEYRLLVEEQTL